MRPYRLVIVGTAMLGLPVVSALGTSLVRVFAAQDQVIIQRGGEGQPAPAADALRDTLSFEAASVKPNKSGSGQVSIGIQPGGRFNAVNVPLRFLIRNAYQLQDFQLVGGPGWITSERFDIIAKAEGDPPPVPPGTTGPFQIMMRNLMADRFRLKVHKETREMPVYALVLARADRQLGPQLRPSTVDCAARGRGRGAPPPPPQPGERPACGMRIGPGTMTGGGFPISQLATALSQFAQRVVLDRTGLTGNFDLDLTWTPDQIPQGPPGGAPAGAPPPPALDGPSLFTALQEQLGLKLESIRGPVEVVVIDSVEQPTAD
ncbi:MAG: hypothetical protein A3G76_06170 [Acidobacteria bacterium RIFCSPLOWO2_12_FULL_65_11]|nr:MAG: hypothetical protein A3H95_05980 [Acidobacteria bacterium RIFCSPLOWO2_02_FULL_64_15]OFW32478.1 MAG: hypothetical protein A3G76_06170 [Acidobacteria bacterium RIFCSPLOWO2_12_FULL_65_11]